MAKLEVLDAVRHLPQPVTNKDVYTYMSKKNGVDISATVTWIALIRLDQEGDVKWNRRNNTFAITGKKAKRNVVEINPDGSISKRLD